MKNSVKVLVLYALGLIFIFIACNKSDKMNLIENTIKTEEADLFIKGDGDFEKIVTKTLIKPDDCSFIVEGTIEFLKNGEIVAIVDFGDGLCDNIATKTIDGKVIEFSLEKKDSKYKKIVVEPLIKIEGCDYIVSGIVKFYEGNKWVATIDFGDGECDQWATKIWDGGSKVISLAKE